MVVRHLDRTDALAASVCSDLSSLNYIVKEKVCEWGLRWLRDDHDNLRSLLWTHQNIYVHTMTSIRRAVIGMFLIHINLYLFYFALLLQ